MSTVENGSSMIVENGMIPAALRAAAGFIVKKNRKPILAGARLTADHRGVTVTAGDCDAGSADGISTGFRASLITNEHNAYTDIVLPFSAVESWGKNDVESINVEQSAAVANGLRTPVDDGAEFPRFVSPETISASYFLPYKTFQTIGKHIGSATDTDSSRYALGGIFMESGADCVRFVGTDGRRLHVARIHGASDGAFSIVIPAAVFTTAGKAIERTIDGRGAAKKRALENLRVCVCFDDSTGRGSFSWNVGNSTFEVSWKKIDGRFPRYRDVFPEYLTAPGSNAGWLDCADIISQSENCRKNVCTENSKGIEISRKDSDGVTITARSTDRGEYRQTVKGFLPMSFSRKIDPAFCVDVVKGFQAFDGADVVGVFSDYETNGTQAGAASAIFFGRPDRIFSTDEDRETLFAAVIMPLAAD
jgi:DNA polymerase-3 subunit beta